MPNRAKNGQRKVKIRVLTNDWSFSSDPQFDKEDDHLDVCHNYNTAIEAATSKASFSSYHQLEDLENDRKDIGYNGSKRAGKLDYESYEDYEEYELSSRHSGKGKSTSRVKGHQDRANKPRRKTKSPSARTMGQEGSSLNLIDESIPPKNLQARTLSALAKYIKDGRARKIVVLTGAGISTSAGIPDFRSPETGLYANLARLNLPYAEAVFDISYFRQHPEPFYILAHELYPGRYRPTITHSFISLLNDKGLLLKLFTQNIDCLEREAGVPDDLVVEAHGSFATQRCIECHTSYDEKLMKEAISSKTVPKCETCKGLVKPDIVFFGEGLPARFFESRHVIADADLAIVLGTSLSVAPFSALPQYFGEDVPRLLINMERVGGLGARLDDVVHLGACDDGIRKLAEELGWLEELEEKWARTAPVESAEAAKLREAEEEVQNAKSNDERLEDEVSKLTKEIEETLRIETNGMTLPTEVRTTDKQQIGAEGGLQATTTVAKNENDKTTIQNEDKVGDSIGSWASDQKADTSTTDTVTDSSIPVSSPSTPKSAL